MSTYSGIIGDLRTIGEDTFSVTVPENWMQGRTTYGGLTAAIGLEAATRVVTDMPIRCAQVSFIGPVGGEVSLLVNVLRRGKSSAFVNVDVLNDLGVMARSVFTFGASRASSIDHSGLPMPSARRPDEIEPFFSSDRPGPTFAKNFEVLQAAGARPLTGASEGDIHLWLRHRDDGAPVTAATLLSIADAPPPAAMPMMSVPAPISSMTWMAEFLSEDVATTDGWYFCRHVADTAHDGYSSQSMMLWNASGKPLMIGRQTVAIFS